MTVSTTTSTVTYTGNGATSTFTFPFIGVGGNDLEVIITNTSTGSQTTLPQNQYTLVINPVPTNGLWGIGGSVTYPISGAVLTSTSTITIQRIVPNVQSISISNQGAFYPQAMEQGLDLIEMQLQQLETSDSFAIRAPSTDISPPSVLPPYPARANTVIGFDSTGLNTVAYPITQPIYPPTTSTVVTVTSASSPYTITSPVNVIFVNATSGNVVLNLAASGTVYPVFISRLDNVIANSVSIIANSGSNTINGAGFINLKYQYQGVTVIQNGSNNWDVFSDAYPLTNPLTPGYKSWTNIFDIINDPNIVTQIQAGSFNTPVDSYLNAAIALGGQIYFPAGVYHLSNTVTMLPGVEFVGAGVGNTIIYTGGTTGAWGFELLNANGTNQVEAPKFRDIYFNVTQNGIRWNSITGGFTNDSSSQAYMMRPRITNCNFFMDSATKYIGVQMNKCFDFSVLGCQFENFLNALDFEGSDIGIVQNSRTDQSTGFDIVANSHSTFGSSLAIRDNDFNNPATGFVNSTYLDILIDNNHMELDGGSTRTNLIQISGSSFITKIHNNRIEPNSFATNWLNITPDVNRYLVSVFDNSNPSSNASMGTVSFSGQTYFNNSSGRCIVRHGGNQNGDNQFPMSYAESPVSYTPPGYWAVCNGNTPGLNSATSVVNPIVVGNGIVELSYNSNTGNIIEFSDWTQYPIESNSIVGPVTIQVTSAGGTAGLIGSWAVYDGGTLVSTGTTTHTVANQYYFTTAISSHTFTSNAGIRFWNADGSHQERYYLLNVAFKIG